MINEPSSEPLLILAMDHRDSFARQFGVRNGPPRDDQLVQMRAAKDLIYRGLRGAHEQLAGSGGQVGVLVDEELGANVLRSAATDGLAVAMPVEKSGQKLFELQYGDDTASHITDFDPDYVKVLVRMNPDDAPDDIAAQLTELASLSQQLRQSGRRLLYELLVPPTDGQLQRVGGQEAYDRDLRPELVTAVIAANYAAGVEPTLWKIEGLETTAAAELVVAAAKADGRTTDCIVLGRDAARSVLDHWLAVAAPVSGFVGFAIGRSIWEDPLAGYLQEAHDDDLIAAVRENYLHFARSYLDARGK